MNFEDTVNKHLEHAGVIGMKWGIRKALQKEDARSAIKSGVNPLYKGAKPLNDIRKEIKSNDWKRFDAHRKSMTDMDAKMDELKQQKYSDIEKGSGSTFSKLVKRYQANRQVEDSRAVALGRGEDAYMKGEKDRKKRVAQKQDALAQKLTTEVIRNYSAALRTGSVFDRAKNANRIDKEYTDKLIKGMFEIERDEP
jgi:hypothetical protein